MTWHRKGYDDAFTRELGGKTVAELQETDPEKPYTANSRHIFSGEAHERRRLDTMLVSFEALVHDAQKNPLVITVAKKVLQQAEMLALHTNIDWGSLSPEWEKLRAELEAIEFRAASTR